MLVKILVWNLQDFFIFLDKYSESKNLRNYTEPHWQQLTASFNPNKELQKVMAISDLILKINPDFCLFTEVAGRESLENLNRYFLKSTYNIFHSPSNSDRGIDIGVLAHQRWKGVCSQFHNHKDFARGLQQITFKYQQKKYHIFLTHLKSKLNKSGKDFEGRSQREIEVKRIIKIIKKLPPFEQNRSILSGDFNGIIYKEQTEEELKPLINKLKMKDVFEVLNKDFYDRSTYCYFDKHKQLNPMQLDYCLLGSELHQYLLPQTCVLDFNGVERTDFPISREEKLKLPSDHYPVLTTLSLN